MERPQNLFLIGPMGVGKSTVGRHLADLMRLQFVDADQEIERRTGATIAWIFEIEGEAGFRRRETQVIRELCSSSGIVLATGGGAVLALDNRGCLKAHGLIVYLQAGLDTLVERTRRDRHRPLLRTADPRAALESIIAARLPLYTEMADLTVSTDGRSAISVAREIVHRVRPESHENALA